MSTSKKRVAVLISGRGSNMASLVSAAAERDYPAEITCVISDRPEAAGLKFAASKDIATISSPGPTTHPARRMTRLSTPPFTRLAPKSSRSQATCAFSLPASLRSGRAG